MNDKYISVSKFKQTLANLDVKGFTPAVKKGIEIALNDAVPQLLDDEPAADVQPVKRGFWKALMMSEETGWDLSLTGGHDAVCEYVCSVCGKPNIVDEFDDSYLPNFCPNCGARMDGGDKDDS